MIPDSFYSDLNNAAESPEQADLRRDLLTTALIEFMLRQYEIKPVQDHYDLFSPRVRQLINEKVK